MADLWNASWRAAAGGLRPVVAATGEFRPSQSKLTKLLVPNLLASDHKYLRICDLCKELGIACLHAHIAAERERQAKTDAGLVPLCPLASMVPVFWR
jgi:hypothetical protein